MNKNTLKQVLERTLTLLRPSAVAAALTAHITLEMVHFLNVDIYIWIAGIRA